MTNAMVPPSDLAAEQSVLGAIMLDPLALPKIAGMLTPMSFYWEKHRTIFMVMETLNRESSPIDSVTVSSKLLSMNRLDDVGGNYYITELAETVAFPRNVEHYAKIVQDKYVLRRTAELGSEMEKRVFQSEADPDQIMTFAQGELTELRSGGNTLTYDSAGPAIDDAWNVLQTAVETGTTIQGVKTGFSDLDKSLSGLNPTDMIIVAARPSMGKTALVTTMLLNQIINGYAVPGFISLEMTKRTIIQRMLAMQSNVPLYRVRSAKMSRDDYHYESIEKARRVLRDKEFYIADSGKLLDLETTCAMIKLLVKRHKVDVVYIDHIGFIKNPDRRMSLNDNVGIITKRLRQVAKEENIPLVVLSQLNRSGQYAESKEPNLAQLRNSGNIEQDADVVIMLHRPYYYDKHKTDEKLAKIAGSISWRKTNQPLTSEEYKTYTQIMIEKQRNGPTGTIEFMFNSETTRFFEPEVYVTEKDRRDLDGYQKDSVPF